MSTLKIHPNDNVAVALADLHTGQAIRVDSLDVTVHDDIPSKHKFALEDLNVGQGVVMYGILIGKAVKPIRRGEGITVNNVTHEISEYSISSKKKPTWNGPDISEFRNLEFLGFHRGDGRVGTANYWIVVPLVFCENRNLDIMKSALLEELGYANGSEYKMQLRELIHSWRNGSSAHDVERPLNHRLFEHVDGVKFLRHHMGCGGTPTDARMLCGLLAGYITHPNVAGATVLSLGCQDAQVELLKEGIQRRDSAFAKPLLIFEQQQHGTERALLTKAMEQTFRFLGDANRARRKPAPLSALTIGVECGGSDGFSGLSANPAIGSAADLIVALGGKVILSEFPELCGVEQELIERCVDPAIAERFISIQRSYSAKAEAVGAGFNLNPSPGNIKDGLITDAMKSAGAVKKGGSSPVNDVLDYPEMVRKPGLNLLCTPGSDVESTTALVGSGANLVLFSTGLGTPTGNPVAPVVKISSNTRVAEKMHDIIDIDAGGIITGSDMIEEVGKRILKFCIEVASGRAHAKAVANGQDDFIPWKREISL